MSTNEFDEIDEAPENGMKALRKLTKTQAEELKALRTEMGKLQAVSRHSGLAEILSARNLDPRVAKFYPKDRETTVESVDEWVAENAELFGSGQTQQTQEQRSALSQSEMDGYETMKKLEAAEAHTEIDFKSRLAACESEEDVMAFLRDYRGPVALNS